MTNQQLPNQNGSGLKKKSGRQWPKVFPRVVLYLVAVSIITFVGAFLSLQTRPVRDAIAGLIVKTIEQNTHAACRIQSLKGNLLSRFEIKGIKLEDPKTRATFASADSIAVSYSIPMLLGRVLWINRLAIDGLLVNLIQEKGGTWNFEMLFSNEAPAPLPDKSSESTFFSDFEVEVRDFLIGNSEVTLARQTDAGETTQHFTGIASRARLGIGKDISATFRYLRIGLDHPDIFIKDFSGDILYNSAGSSLDINGVNIKGEQSDFTVSGLLYFPVDGPGENMSSDFNIDLRADIKELSLGEFGRAFPVQMPDEDIVSGTLSVTGPLSKMDCQVDLRMASCQVESKGLLTIDENNDVGLDITGKTKGLDLSVLPLLELESFPGNLNADFSLAWQQIGMPDQTGRINLDVTSSVLWGYELDRATLDVRISADDFIFDGLHLKTPYGKLDGTLRLDGILSSEKDNQILFSADVENFNPENLVRNKQYAGSINGTVRSSIFIPKTFEQEKITAEAACRIDSSQLMNVNVSSAELEASWQDETILMSRFGVETAIGTAAAEGEVSIRDETCRLNAHAMFPDLKRINSFFPGIDENSGFFGSIKAAARIEGPWDNLYVTATLNGENVSFQDVSADSFSADGKWSGNTSEYNASAKCRMKTIQRNGLKIPALDFESTITPASIRAALELKGGQDELLQLSGNISRWLEPEKEVLIDKMSVVSFDQPPLVNREPVKLFISPDRIHVDSLNLDSGDASLALKGDVMLNPPAAVSADLSLRDLNLKRIGGFWESGKKIQGRLSSDVHVSGFLEKPIIRMTVSGKEVSYDDLPVTDLSVALDYQETKFNLTGSGVMDGEKFLDISGSASTDIVLYPFAFSPRTETLIAALKLDQFDISEISEFLLGTDQLRGHLSSDITISGEPEKPDIIIDASIKEAMFDKFPVSHASAAIKYSDSKSQITASVYRQNKKLLDLNGSSLMDLSLYPFELNPKPDGLDLAINMDQMDISWISDIINDPEYDIRGVLDVAASVSGDLFHPSVQGRMQLIDGELGLKQQDLVYETLKADLRFVENSITIENIDVGGDKEGILHLSGVLTHKNFKPQTFNIRAEGNQLYVPFHSGVDARINPDITLSGAWDAPVLKGRIKVSEGRVNLQRFLEKKLPEIEIIEHVVDENGVLRIPEKEPKPLEFVDPLSADVAVIIPDDFWFRGEDEFFEIKGAIQLRKDPYKPFVLFGSVMPVRGTYRFRGKLFQIKQGELIFNGQEDINPVVNIQAETKIDDVTIIIRLAGTFDQINLILDSDPAMAQADIISYLIFGRAPDDLSEEESFQAGEAALSYTGQIAADKLRDIVGDTLGIDYLSISAGSGGLRQGSLTMGKYVLPKVFVTFRQGFDESATQKVEVTYEINKYFDLETQIDNEQTSAVDLIWKYEY